jgi:aromatic-L-amino-acid decarboxylase
MLDDILSHCQNVRENPVWRPVPDAARAHFREPVPQAPGDLASIQNRFLQDVLPYGSGNIHPRFMGWVQGGGTVVGMLADMLAAGMNCNLGGRNHGPAEVERQVVEWVREIFQFPRGSTGLFLNGTSAANLTAAVIARDAALMNSNPKRLTAYASTAIHGCVLKAFHVMGLGTDALRRIPTDSSHRIDIAELKATIARDRHNGFTPFLLVGTAGTVDIGAIDDLASLADVAREEKIWFHIDGAYAALGMLSPDVAPLLNGIERADSLAFDFHKWGQVPYAAGFLLVRHGTLHRESFASPASYLQRATRGLAAGSEWPCDLGIDLSRGFAALKTWFTFNVYGTEALGEAISRCCRLARYLERLIGATPELELMAPVQLNVVCFRFRAAQPDRVNAHIVMELQESGTAAPSTTLLNGQTVIRAAIVNHRTAESDIDALIEGVVAIGLKLNADRTPDWKTNTGHHCEERLEALEREPDSLAVRLERGDILVELGRMSEARNEYLAALAKDPGHCAALNNLGSLLHASGYRQAAITALAEAVRNHPQDSASRVNLANVLVEAGSPLEARDHYNAVLRRDPASHVAHQGMARTMLELGDAEAALLHREKGFRSQWLTTLPYRGKQAPTAVLLLASAEGGNIPIRHLLNDTEFHTSIAMVDYYDQEQPLPGHHLIFNSIGDADLATRALRGAEWLAARSSAPLVNPIPAVLATTRENNARRLRSVPGVLTARTVTLPREVLSSSAAAATLAIHGLQFPILLRTPGFHTGKHFVMVQTAQELTAALDFLPGPDLLVMQYLNARGSDGKARKYRVMMIDGQLFPLHLAISKDWKIHYFTAEMTESAEHRAEDAAFLADMPGVLGSRAMAALREIQQLLGLDYAGIDFGLNESGDVLLFEANATMVVLPPDPAPHWNYRRPAVERIYRAVVHMIRNRARGGHGITQ